MHNTSTRISIAERGHYSEYGTQYLRLARDSQQQFEQCSICLHDLADPISCQQGHLFCKACIYTSLFDQKKANKRRLKQWEEGNKLTAARDKAQQHLEDQEKMRAFESQTTTLVSSSAKSSEEKQAASQSWWLPSEAPEAAKNSGAKPCQDTHCPRTGHVIRVKDLTVVEFKHEKPMKKVEDSEDIDKRARGTDFICHVCAKDLKSISKVIMLKGCGHAICYKCSDEFAKKKCPVCDKPCDEYNEKLQLQPPASSYAAGGSTIAKTDTPSAVIM